ncbi:MAG: hypothetical protein LBJ73_04005 [Rickettsiales bacterium]|nr:hypothetical protein [Rickettsiales bacterium]
MNRIIFKLSRVLACTVLIALFAPMPARAEIAAKSYVDSMFIAQAQSELLNLVYPVGSIYISIVSTNPGTLFGGTWVAFGAGRVLIGAGTGTDTRNQSIAFSANGTGGEYNHVLTVNELAAHEHATNTYNGSLIYLDYNGVGSGSNRILNAAYSPAASNPLRAQSTGGNAAHNNIQPYIVVYMWRRTA